MNTDALLHAVWQCGRGDVRRGGEEKGEGERQSRAEQCSAVEESGSAVQCSAVRGETCAW